MGQGFEALTQALLGLFVQREVKQFGLLKVTQAIVDATVNVDDFGVLFDQGNRWQEARPLQAVLVQSVRNNVRGRHQGYAVFEQFFHQGAENHGIGNVRYKEFVKTDHPRLIREALGDDGQRVLFAIEGTHLFMHALHEAVEVSAHLLLERQRVEERIDQISLAPAHASPEIEAFDRRLLFFAEQLAEQTRLALRSSHQVVVQALQMAHGVFLCGIVKEVRAFQINLISF